MELIIIRTVENAPFDGVTVKDSEGDYNIYIRAGMSPEQRFRVLQHELAHIECGHFYTEDSVSAKEKEADEHSTDLEKHLCDFIYGQ